MKIEFNKYHYSDLAECREFYKNTLGPPPDSDDKYHYYINMIGLALAPHHTATNKFPYTVSCKQELIKILMLVQADAVKGKLDVSSLKDPIPSVPTPVPVPLKRKGFFRRKK